MLDQPRDEWKFALWSALALEHLARAALAHISPVLLADQKDWNNLYSALGNTPKVRKFVPKSIEISAVVARLREIVPGFDEHFEGIANLHSSRRNEELHSGGLPYDVLKNSTWLPGYYELCELLLMFMGESLATFLGQDEATVAADMIAAAKNQSAKSVLASVKAHMTVWENKSPTDQTTLASQALTWAARHEGHRVTCPACSSPALLSGSPTAPPTVAALGNEIVETQYFLPSRFECVACGLKISSLAELHAVDLSDPYKATTTYTIAEYYADQFDRYAEYEPDYNEP
jgi:hypothetical protein